MPKIVNETYKQFLDPAQWVETLNPDVFKSKLDLIDYPNKHKTEQAKGLLSLLYWSGARPVEIMLLTPENFLKEGQYYVLRLTTKKSGNPRMVLLPRSPEVTAFYDYAKRGMPNQVIFYKFYKQGEQTVSWNTHRKLLKETPDGFIEVKQDAKKSKVYQRFSSNTYYVCKKWLGIPPYFLRHNRFTRFIEAGGDIEGVKDLKGSKDLRSAYHYVKYSKKKAIKNVKFIK